jgi:hypothetical protein
MNAVVGDSVKFHCAALTVIPRWFLRRYKVAVFFAR